jgi:transcriptional regulator GlxA family with amidase domain
MARLAFMRYPEGMPVKPEFCAPRFIRNSLSETFHGIRWGSCQRSAENCAASFLPTGSRRERIVRDGNLITAGGVTPGIDFELALIAELFGRKEAETVQLSLEYTPYPTFTSGTPDQASPAMLAEAMQRMISSRLEREAILRRLEMVRQEKR